MKTWTPSLALVIGAFALLFESTPLHAQGSLTPPAGAPTPTMKSLDIVEARIPLYTTSNSGIDITESGSYYLTDNLTLTGNAITISASNVTLDLNGFALQGDGSSTFTYGVQVTKSGEDLKNVIIRNGSIDGFAYGIYFNGVSNGSITQVRISHSQRTGLTLYSKSGFHCSNNLISKCSVNVSGSEGISLFALGNTNGNRVELCTISKSEGKGISVRSNSGGVVRGNAVSLCNVSEAGEGAILLYAGPSSEINENNTIERCAVYDAATTGIYVSYGKGVVVRDNSVNKASKGISFTGGAGNRIVRNVAEHIEIEGVTVATSDACLIENNHVSNVTSSTSTGFNVANSSVPCVIIKNSSVGCADNFFFTSSNSMGAENSVTGTIGATNSHYGAPWTNFSIDQTP